MVEDALPGDRRARRAAHRSAGAPPPVGAPRPGPQRRHDSEAASPAGRAPPRHHHGRPADGRGGSGALARRGVAGDRGGVAPGVAGTGTGRRHDVHKCGWTGRAARSYARRRSARRARHPADPLVVGRLQRLQRLGVPDGRGPAVGRVLAGAESRAGRGRLRRGAARLAKPRLDVVGPHRPGRGRRDRGRGLGGQLRGRELALPAVARSRRARYGPAYLAGPVQDPGDQPRPQPAPRCRDLATAAVAVDGRGRQQRHLDRPVRLQRRQDGKSREPDPAARPGHRRAAGRGRRTRRRGPSDGRRASAASTGRAASTRRMGGAADGGRHRRPGMGRSNGRVRRRLGVAGRPGGATGDTGAGRGGLPGPRTCPRRGLPRHACGAQLPDDRGLAAPCGDRLDTAPVGVPASAGPCHRHGHDRGGPGALLARRRRRRRGGRSRRGSGAGAVGAVHARQRRRAAGRG